MSSPNVLDALLNCAKPCSRYNEWAQKSSSGYEDAAIVKMRDSVSFCKQILFEYVLKKQDAWVGFIHFFCGSVRGSCCTCILVMLLLNLGYVMNATWARPPFVNFCRLVSSYHLNVTYWRLSVFSGQRWSTVMTDCISDIYQKHLKQPRHNQCIHAVNAS